MGGGCQVFPLFAGAQMAFLPESHKTLITLLRYERKSRVLSLVTVAARLPAWMKFDFSKLARIERGQRDVSYGELREIAKALGTDIVSVVAQVEYIIAAKVRVDRPRKKK